MLRPQREDPACYRLWAVQVTLRTREVGAPPGPPCCLASRLSQCLWALQGGKRSCCLGSAGFPAIQQQCAEGQLLLYITWVGVASVCALWFRHWCKQDSRWFPRLSAPSVCTGYNPLPLPRDVDLTDVTPEMRLCDGKGEGGLQM